MTKTTTTATPHRWTFAEVHAELGDKAICTTAGRGLFIKAACNYDGEADPPMGNDEAFFDVTPSWGDAIGALDKCDRSVTDLERRIQARFPTPRGWSYDSMSGIIVQG